jgi:hypothetical protein
MNATTSTAIAIVERLISMRNSFFFHAYCLEHANSRNDGKFL